MRYKAPQSSASEWLPIVYRIFSPTHDLGSEHHSVPVDMPAAVSEAFICPRIANAILPRIFNFPLRREKTKVIVKRARHTPQKWQVQKYN